MSRHPVDLFSFVCGLLVLAAGLVLLSGNLDQVPLEWAGPMAAIALGVVIAIAAASSRGRRDESGEP
jgi:peptidoglycan/LPS O-acetylase OafA/YrhL